MASTAVADLSVRAPSAESSRRCRRRGPPEWRVADTWDEWAKMSVATSKRDERTLFGVEKHTNSHEQSESTHSKRHSDGKHTLF